MKKFWYLFVLAFIATLSLSCQIGLGKAVDTAAPELTIVTPAADSVIREAFAISGTWSDDGEITALSVSLARTDSIGNTYGPFEGTFDTDSEGSGSWSAVINPLAEGKEILDGAYVATVSITDGGAHTTKQSINFVIDNTAPVIVLQRPSTKASESSADSYGRSFTLVGQAADDNNVDMVEVRIFSDAECTSLIHTVQLHNVPPTIELDVAKFVEGTENDYSKIYGSTTKNGVSPKLYCSIIAYDASQRYPVGEKQATEDTLGNYTTNYYLYEDISTLILADYKITEVYHMLNGCYVDSEGDSARAADTVSSVRKVLDEKVQTVGSFTLNPENNPKFSVSGHDALNLDGKDFASAAHNLSSGGALVVDVSTGLDSIPLKGDTLKPFIINCDENGAVSGDRIYFEEFQKTKSGTSYKIVFTVNKSASIVIGKNYIVGIEGTDESGNEVVASGKAYGFHFSPSGVAPKLTDISSLINGTKSASENNLYVAAKNPSDKSKSSLIKISGNVQSDDPEVKVSFKLDGKDLGDLALSKVEAEKYSFSKEIDTATFENPTKSAQHEIEIIASNSAATPTSVSKIVMFDASTPDIALDESVTTIAKKYDPAKEDGTALAGSYLNGTVDIKIQISDDAEGTGVETSAPNKPYFEIIDADGHPQSIKLAGESVASTKHYIEKPASQVVTIDTTLLAEGKTTFRIHAWDKAGNSYSMNGKDYFEAEYFVEQATDKPYIATTDANLAFATCNSKESVDAIRNDPTKTRTNIFAIGSTIKIKLVDDDGLKSYLLKVGKWDSATNPDADLEILKDYYDDAANKEAGKTINGTTYEVPFTPESTGYYRLNLTAKDTNGVSCNTREFWVLITGSTTITDIERTPETITLAAPATGTNGGANLINAAGSIKNVITIDSADGPFTIYRLEKTALGNPNANPPVADTYYEEKIAEDYASNTYTDAAFKPYADRIENKVTYKVVDQNGNAGTKTVSYFVDSTVPVIGTISYPDKNATQGKNFTFVADVTDAAPTPSLEKSSGVVKVQYKFGQNATVHENSASSLNQVIIFDEWDGTPAGEENIFGTEGDKEIWVRAIDSVGNASDWKKQSFVYDKSAPKISYDNMTNSLPKGTYTLTGKVEESFEMQKLNDLADVLNGEYYITLKEEVGASSITKKVKLTKVSGSSDYTFSVPLPFNPDADGTIIYTFTGYDKIGNALDGTTEFRPKRDLTPPEITITTPSSSTFGEGAISSETAVFRGTIKELNPNKIYYQWVKADSTGNYSAPTELTTTDVTSGNVDASWKVIDISDLGIDGEGNANWNLTATFNSNAASRDGKYTLYVQAADMGGNISEQKSQEFAVDSAAPSIIVKVIPYINDNDGAEVTATLSGSSTIKVTSGIKYKLAGTVTDTNGIKKLTVNGTEITPASDGSWETDYVSTEGVKTFTIVAEDKSGKETVAGKKSEEEKSVIFDLYDPTVTISTIPSDNAWISGTGDLYISGTAADNSGISSITVSIDGGTATDVAVSSPWTYTLNCRNLAETGLEAAGFETNLHTIEVVVTDKCEKPKTLTRNFKLDKSTPVLSISSAVDSNSNSKYTNDISNVKISGSAYDGVAGRAVASVVVTESTQNSSVTLMESAAGSFENKNIASKTFAEGTYTFAVKATDYAGNAAPEEVIQIVVDKTRPTVGTPTLDNWTQKSGTTWAIGTPHNGNRAKLTVTPTDTNLDSVYYYIKEDSDSTYSSAEDVPANEWVSMNGSNGTYTANLSFPDGTGYVWVKVLDKATNVSYSTSTTYNVDTTEPELCEMKSLAVGDGSFDTTFTSGTKLVNGQNDIKFTVEAKDLSDATRITSVNLSYLGASFTANSTNGGVGIASTVSAEDSTKTGIWTITIPKGKIFALTDGTHSVKVKVTDIAQNTREFDLFKLKIDKTAPVPSFKNIFDADETDDYQVNGTITLGGVVTEQNTIASVILEYKKGDNWVEVPHTNQDVGTYNWSYEEINTADSTKFTDKTTYKFRITATDEAGNPGYAEQEITIDQDTDRPRITFSNLELRNSKGSMSSSNYVYITNLNTLYGNIADDDGITSFGYKKEGDENFTPITVSNGGFTIPGLAEGAQKLIFQVVDKGSTTFTSSANGGPKLIGSEASAQTFATDTQVYLRVNTARPAISNVNFYRYDAYKDGTDKYETTSIPKVSITSSRFGGDRHTKVKIKADVQDANGVDSVVVKDGTGNTVGTGACLEKDGDGNPVSTADDAVHTWTISDIDLTGNTTSGTYTYKIVAIDANGTEADLEGTDDFQIVMDMTPPTMEVTSHNNGAAIRTSFTLKGTVDDATASMKYIITDSADAPDATKWASAKQYRVPTGDSISSWSITFDGDTLNSLEEHTDDQKTWFVELYGSATASGTTNGIVKNTQGTIVEKCSNTSCAGVDGASGCIATHTKYRTKKTFYLHFQLTDSFGNVSTNDRYNLVVDPQGDIPVITMNYPMAESYAYYSETGSCWAYEAPARFDVNTKYNDVKSFTVKVDEEDKTFTDFKYKGPYTPASGRISVSGTAEDDKTIKGLYMQIDPAYSPTAGFTWTATAGSKIAGKYAVEDIYSKYNGSTVGTTGIYIGNDTTWNVKLNADNEFNGAGTANNTIAIKLLAVDEDGNIYQGDDADVMIITIDSGAPKIGETTKSADNTTVGVAFELWQYAWTNVTGTTRSVVYTKTNTPTTSSYAYTDSECKNGTGTAITAVTADKSKITVGGKVYDATFLNKSYSDGMWLNGMWWLVGSVEDESGISSVKIGGTSIIDDYCEAKTYIVDKTTYTENNDYLIRYPIGRTSANTFGSLSYTLTVQDVGANPKENSATFSINYDNKNPVLSDNTDSSYNISTDVVNTDGFYTLSSVVTEGDGESGFARTVVYFKRTATGFQNVYDVFLPKDSSPIAYAGLHEEDGMYWQTANVTAINDKVLTVTTTSNVHKGGIVKFGGAIYTIKAKTGTTVTLDEAPNSSLVGSDIYFGIGAVVDRSGTEGASSSTKISSGEGKGYWSSIAGDDDFMVERVTTQGTRSTWEGNINTKNIPDGPIEIHYVVYDKAGNSSHGSVTTNAFVKNNAPMIASVTVGTTFSGGDEPEYEETYYVSEKTRKIGGKEVKKSIGVSSNVTVAGNEQGTKGFMTIKDKSWIKPEVVGGNGKLSYKYNINGRTDSALIELGTATKESGEDYLNATDQNELKYVDGQIFTIPITTTDLGTATSTANSTIDAPTSFNYTISDETEGVTGGLTATVSVKLAVNFKDESAPKSVILPFEWNGTGMTEYSERENNTYVVRCNVPNNNLYEGSLENGHIELTGDLPDSFTSSESKVNDLDPKVSGKISIRGYAYDDIRLSNIWIKMDSFTFTGGTAGTGSSAGYVKAASYNSTSKSWSGAGDFETNGWKFTVFASNGTYETLPDSTHTTYEAKHNNNLGVYYGSYFNQNGHKVYWQLDLDTEKLTNVAGTDKTLTVLVEAARGETSYKYSSTTASSTEGDANLNTPSYRMDVVPYITSVGTMLAGKDKNVKGAYSRTSSGKYPVSSAETDITFEGFNLTGGTVVFNGTNETAALNSGKIARIPAEARTGAVKITVGAAGDKVDSLNNLNNDNACGSYKQVSVSGTVTRVISSSSSYSDMTKYAYNRKPNNVSNNLLTDDVWFDIWELNKTAATSGSIMKDPVMHINPVNGQIGFGFVKGSDSVSFPGNDASYTWFQKNLKDYIGTNFVYDAHGVAHNVSIGLDAQYGSGIAGRMNYNNSNWYKGNNGSSRVAQWDKRYNIALETIGIPNGIYVGNKGANTSTVVAEKAKGGLGLIDINRFVTPSIAVATHGTTDSTVYLMYYDTVNDQMRFRYGAIPYVASPSYTEGNWSKDRGNNNNDTATRTITASGTGRIESSTETRTWNNNNWENNISYTGTESSYNLLNDSEAELQRCTSYGAPTEAASDNGSTSIPSDANVANERYGYHGMFEASKKYYALVTGKYYNQNNYKYNDGNAGTLGSDTGNKGSRYYGLDVVAGNSLANDKVVMIWYDETPSTGGLKYTYRENLTTGEDNTDARSAGVNGKWGATKTLIPITSMKLKECVIKTDSEGGIHIAAYDLDNDDLIYLYMPSYNWLNTSTNKVYKCVVDAYSQVGTCISIDIAKNSDGNVVPYISYFSEGLSSLPKMAYLKDGIDSTNVAGSIVDGADVDTTLFSGKWEVTLLPTDSILQKYSVGIGVWKDGQGKATNTYTTTSSSNVDSNENERKLYGNGISDLVISYCTDISSTGYMETAMRR